MHFNIPIFVPHAGCPHDCVFCNQKNITGYDHAQDLKQAKQIIEEHLESIQRKYDDYTVEIAFFGGSFTGIPAKLQCEYLSLAKQYITTGLIDGIRLSTRPDYIDIEIIERLQAYGVTTIELGVQSLVEEVLVRSNRGHSLEDVDKACQLIKKSGLKLGLQMMIGLPGDTVEKSIQTTTKIISLKPDMVRIYPTIVIEGTELETMYNAGMYHALRLEDAVAWAAVITKMFYKENIPVIRIGLQASEALSNAVAGPYHPSFRQFVESRFYYETLDNVLRECKEALIYINSKELSSLVGQKRHNLNVLEKKYKIKKIKVYPKELPSDFFEISIDGEVFKVPKMTII